MPTIFQMIVNRFFSSNKKKKPVSFYNPLNVKPGASITIDTLDLRHQVFQLQTINCYEIVVNKNKHYFTDYLLHGNVKDNTIDCRLRICPDKIGSENSFRAIPLFLYDSFGYDKNFHDVVKDTTKKISIEDNNGQEEYWRVNDIGLAISAKIKNHDNSQIRNVRYWDYSRLTNLEGVEIEQFLFVEMGSDNGWFELWRGFEVNRDRVITI